MVKTVLMKYMESNHRSESDEEGPRSLSARKASRKSSYSVCSPARAEAAPPRPLHARLACAPSQGGRGRGARPRAQTASWRGRRGSGRGGGVAP